MGLKVLAFCASKAAHHREALRHYFSVINRARQPLDCGEPLTEPVVNELRAKYEDTESLPKMPESKFLKLNQYHLRKTVISRVMEKTPHIALRHIMRRLREREE